MSEFEYKGDPEGWVRSMRFNSNDELIYGSRNPETDKESASKLVDIILKAGRDHIDEVTKRAGGARVRMTVETSSVVHDGEVEAPSTDIAPDVFAKMVITFATGFGKGHRHVTTIVTAHE